MESIKEILVQIQKSQKKLVVKITVFLKKLEDILFKKKEKLDGNTIRFLLVGGDKDLHGLMQICGVKSKFKGSLKNSSFQCVKLLLRLFKDHPQKKEILQTFYDLDEEEFLSMKLGAHMMSDNKNENTSFEIARIIKEKRPHLGLKSYIQEKVAQERFEEWLKTYKSQQAQGKQQVQWQEKEEPDQNQQRSLTESAEFRPSNVRKREEKKIKRQKYFAEVHLQNFERTLEYYKLTFQDPLFQAFEDDEEDMSKSQLLAGKKRKASANKNMFKSVFSKVLSKPEEIENAIKKNGKNLEQPLSIDEIIPKIHIESPDFDPVLFLTLFHTGTENKFLTEAAKQVGKQQVKGISMNKGLVYFYLDSFLDVHRCIVRSHSTFINVEASKSGGRLKQIGESQLKLKQTVGTISEELQQMKAKCSEMRLTLSFLNKNEMLINMPSQLKKYYNQFEFERISKIFQQAFPYLRRYLGMSIFTMLFSEIDRILQMSQDVVISKIESNLNNKRTMNLLTNILLDLQFDINRKEVNKVEKAKKQSDFDKKAEILEIEDNLMKMIIFLENKLIDDINRNANIALSTSSPSISESMTASVAIVRDSISPEPAIKKDRQRKIDMINNIQFDSDRLQQFVSQNNSLNNQRTLRIKEVEQYFQENMIKIECFYSLLQSYYDGEYDYKLPNTSSEKKPKPQVHFQPVFNALKSAADKSVDYLVSRYNNQILLSQEGSQEFKLLIQKGKDEIISCSNILFLLKQLDQQVRLGGKQITDLIDKFMKIAYQVQIFNLKVVEFENFDFYSSLEISKTFANENEFRSIMSDSIFETLLSSTKFITSIKVFRPVDMTLLHQNFLLEAISLSFKTAFLSVMKTQQKLATEESNQIQAQASPLIQAKYSKDEVLLLFLSNIQSFKQFQCKQLLQSIFDQANLKKGLPLADQKNSIKNINELIAFQTKAIRDLMGKMVTDLIGKLASAKAQSILEKSQDLFVMDSIQQKVDNLKQSISSLGDKQKIFDSHSVYNASITQLLQPSSGNSNPKYEIRYKILDILSELNQFIQSIVLNCGEVSILELPHQVLNELLSGIKKILDEKQKSVPLLLLKQIRIELEFLQDITVKIKSIVSQTSFSDIYALIDKIFQENFGNQPANVTLFKIESSKLKGVIRETKYKFDWNFKFFV